MSDPVIFVECLSEKKSTIIKKKCINAVWDQVLFFEFKNLDCQEINEGKCLISCFDANNLTRNVLIGSYEFDLANIYFNNEYHEIYKQWIGLFDVTDEFGVDDNDNDDNNQCQGYIKLSIVVLGPNDEQKTHKLIDEDDDETNLLSVLIPPIIEQTPYLLSISIYECKDIIINNDLFIIIQFAGCKIKSSIKKCQPLKNNISTLFDILSQLQIPVMEPIMSQTIKISFYNYNRTKKMIKLHH